MDAVAPPPFSQRALQWLRKEALPLLIMLGLLATARDTLANHYQVPSGSMQLLHPVPISRASSR